MLPDLNETDRINAISSLRKKEDRVVLRHVSARIKIKDLDLLDAPLRFKVSATSVCDMKLLSPNESEIEHLSVELRKYFVSSLVLAPLALGGHVDHRTVSAVAVRTVAPSRLAFYEDLPYATWTPESMLLNRVTSTQRETGISLKPYVVRIPKLVAVKRRSISRYSSQITNEEAAGISRFALRYGGGERIWIPKQRRIWQLLI